MNDATQSPPDTSTGGARPSGLLDLPGPLPRARPLPDWLHQALTNDDVVERYHAKILAPRTDGCWLWTGAITGKGHGRFWIGHGRVIIAHRFGYALAHPGQPLPQVVAHRCDNPLCQSPLPGHMVASTFAENRAEWAARRHTIAGPLRDRRGARGRAHALRDAARTGRDLAAVSAEGVRPVERDQLPLW